MVRGAAGVPFRAAAARAASGVGLDRPGILDPPGAPSSLAPLVSSVVYVLAISVTPHKETRFLYPALVILTVVAMPGVALALERLCSQALVYGLSFLMVLAGASTFFITRQTNPTDEFHAIVAVGRDADASGLLILDERPLGTGGFFYLGRDIPWPTCISIEEPTCAAGLRNPRINRALAQSAANLKGLRAAGFRPVRTIGQEVILAR